MKFRFTAGDKVTRHTTGREYDVICVFEHADTEKLVLSDASTNALQASLFVGVAEFYYFPPLPEFEVGKWYQEDGRLLYRKYKIVAIVDRSAVAVWYTSASPGSRPISTTFNVARAAEFIEVTPMDGKG